MENKKLMHVDLASIKDPTFLKAMSYDELDALSSDICSYLIDIVSKNGGHLSSNLGVIDSTIALCRVFDFAKDKIIFDVGHQSYTYKLLTGRDLSSLRKKDGISGFQKREESPYDHYEAGHSSTSISAALGMAIARDLNNQNYNVISYIGDSSLVNGLSFEALNNNASGEHKIIVVVNDNDMSISKSVGALSMMFRKLSVSNFYFKSRNGLKKTLSKCKAGRAIYSFMTSIKNFIKSKVMHLTIFDHFGFSVIGPIDGHNIKKMEKAFIQAKKNYKSTVIAIKTIKGKGYKYAEEDKEGKWHGVGKFNVSTGEIFDTSNISWSEFYSSLIEKRFMNTSNSVCITPGTGYGSGLSPLFKYYPTRMFDVGIAEEHAFTMATSLSLGGYQPIICIYSTFMQRAYDELHHDLARMNANATILIDRAGLVGSDGETHQGLYDEAFVSSIPNVVMSMASNTQEAKCLFYESFNKHGPFCIRFPKENIVKAVTEYPVEFGKWLTPYKGNSKTCIITHGPIINDLISEVKNNNIDVTIFNAIYLRPLDEELLKNIVSIYSKIIIYDVYSTENGFINIIASHLYEIGYKGVIIKKGIPNTYVKQATINEQRELFNIDIKSIITLLKDGNN